MKKFFFICIIALIISSVSKQNVLARQPYRWRPEMNSSFYYQLSGQLNLRVASQLYFVDLFVPITTIQQLKMTNRRVICRIQIGVYSRNHPDQNNISKRLLANPVTLSFQQSYINYNNFQTTGLLEVMQLRIDQAKSKGCDAVMFDDYDFYEMNQITGLSLTPQLQIDYFITLAEYAQLNGLSVGLLNNINQFSRLLDYSDFAIGENCDSSGLTCNHLKEAILAGKAVFVISYTEDYSYSENNEELQWQIHCLRHIYQNYSWIVRSRFQLDYHTQCVLNNNYYVLQTNSSNNLFAILLFSVFLFLT